MRYIHPRKESRAGRIDLGRWTWLRLGVCRRCQSLRSHHGLELPELVALWEAQGRRCYRYPDCPKLLADPRQPSPERGASHKGEDGTWEIRIDHDHQICPKVQHSCERCRRGLACNACNCHDLAISSRVGLWVIPEQDRDLNSWLEFLGPEDRDRLRKALTLCPEQPARKGSRRQSRSESAPEEATAALFDLDAYRTA